MAASAWTIFDKAKKRLGNNDISLSASGFIITLHRTSASANLVGDVTIFSSIGSEVSATGGYTDLALSGQVWTTGASAGEYKWDVTDPVFTASGSAINNVRYAVIRLSVGSTSSGYPLCYAALSTAAFNVSSGNTLTIQMNSSGVFTLS